MFTDISAKLAASIFMVEDEARRVPIFLSLFGFLMQQSQQLVDTSVIPSVVVEGVLCHVVIYCMKYTKKQGKREIQ